jgi:hypothetical protein
MFSNRGESSMFSKIRAVDIAIVLLAVTIGMGTYVWAGRTPATGGMGTPRLDWETIAIHVGPDQAWLREFVQPGLQRLDPRNQQPVAEVVGVEDAPEGAFIVRARVMAAHYPNGAVLFDAKPLLPGQNIRLETQKCVIEGRIRRVGLP